MKALALALAAALTACGPDHDQGDPCAAACELASPGKVPIVCDPGTWPSPGEPAGNGGGCFCTDAGECPAGWVPH